MRWFKHFSRAHRDTKIKRIINEFGAEGYAVYFYCLELAADALESDNITFEIEDDAELIAQYLKMDSVKTARIMQRCVDFELLSIADSGRIAALKMAKFLDERFTRNDALKAMIKSEKMADVKHLLSEDKHKTTGDNTVKIILSETRREETREEKKEARPRFVPPSVQEISAYLKEKQIVGIDPEAFISHYESNGWKVGRNPMVSWKAAITTWRKNADRFSAEKRKDNVPRMANPAPKGKYDHLVKDVYDKSV